jgi:hypothetical protein
LRPIKRLQERIYMRGLRARVARDQPALRQRAADDWTRVNALREWVFTHAPTGSASLLLDHTRLSPAELLRALLRDRGTAWCGGAARAMQVLAEAHGMPALILDLGGPELDSHTVTLVQVRHHGQRVLTVQDAYFNTTYVDTSGNPLDYWALQELIRERRHTDIGTVRGQPLKPFLIAQGEQWPEISGIVPGTQLANGAWKHLFPATFEHFVRHGGSRAPEQLERLALPPDPIYLYLFARGVWGSPKHADIIAPIEQSIETRLRQPALQVR